MYNIFFNDTIISFANIKNVEAVRFEEFYFDDDKEEFTITKMLEIVENCKRIWVVSADQKSAFERFCGKFKQVNAGGGVVRDILGRVLMIFRDGVWDLAKGHVDRGEAVEAAARREVREETGVVVEPSDDLIAITRHIYELNGKWRLKHTYWYAMRADELSDYGELILQENDEKIEKVEWFEWEEAEQKVEQSYASIRELFRKYKQQGRAFLGQNGNGWVN